ncbi:MAG TPA: ATP-binding protein, partial [Bdellovibrionales bacterium]|nr:ATP-binding protein [Bdellovibrionales bacterium]
KSTAARLVHGLLAPPADAEWPLLTRIARQFGEPARWRPLVQPHHTIPALSMIGGCRPVRAGEITRAHGGILLLDELLEFDVTTQEALREPVERGVIAVARAGEAVELPARFLLLATANLCRCGQYAPTGENGCTCSEKRRRQYLERLSGPTLDRFDLFVYTNGWLADEKDTSLEGVRERVRAAQRFASARGRSSARNRDLGWDELHREVSDFQRRLLGPLQAESMRRTLAVLRVARTCADLDQSESLRPHHLDEAMALCWASVKALRSDAMAF